uniref:Cytochrome c oxidase assembly protein COX16, mitochondrial n=1 Tax=Blastobotrys adeninivorans TaxID=409370 RepID=A0A060T3A2_BLAAD
MAFQSKTFYSKKQVENWNKSFLGRAATLAKRHHFLLIGLPFMSIVAGGAYMLSFFTQLRYEKHDQRAQSLSEEEALSIVKNRRKVDMKEEYYKLQQMDLDSWEQVRVPRFPGESENKW